MHRGDEEAGRPFGNWMIFYTIIELKALMGSGLSLMTRSIKGIIIGKELQLPRLARTMGETIFTPSIQQQQKQSKATTTAAFMLY